MLDSYRENPEVTAFNKLIFRSIPGEKNLDKLPPPENQSPKNWATLRIWIMTIKIKEEIGHLEPPDQNQPETLLPRAWSDHGLPDADTEDK